MMMGNVYGLAWAGLLIVALQAIALIVGIAAMVTLIRYLNHQMHK